MSASIVPLRRSLVTLVDSPASIKLVQHEILVSKLTYTEISRRAAISASTVSNIATGATRYPRIETVIRILGAMGWIIQATRRDT